KRRPAEVIARRVAWMVGDHRLAADRRARVSAEETHRRTIYEEPVGDRDDDDRRRRVAGDRGGCRQTRSRHVAAWDSRRIGGWWCSGVVVDSGFESLRLDDHGRLVCGSHARDSGALFVLTLDAGHRREWLA